MSVTAVPEFAPPSGKFALGFEGALALSGIGVLLVALVFAAGRGTFAEKTDFSSIYIGASIVHQGDGPKLYSLQEQKRLRVLLFEHPNPQIYDHPAYEVVFLAPLARMPFKTAYITWGLTNVFLWLLLACLLRPYVPVPKNTVGYFVIWLLFAPLGVALYQGQPSIVLLLFYTMVFINLKRGHELTAGIWLALGLFKFQFVLPFALIFLLRRKWRFFAGFLLSATVLGLVSLIAVGWQGSLSYVQLLFTIAHNPSNAAYGAATDMPTIRGFIYAILGDRIGLASLSFIVAALSVFLLALTAWRWRQVDREAPERSLDTMFAGALAVSLLTGFHMLSHDLSPLMLSMLLVASHFPGRSRPILRWAVGSTLVCLLIPPLYFILLAGHHLYLICPVLVVFALSAFSLAGSGHRETLIGGELAPAR